MDSNKGFTLLEMLIVIVLMSIVMWGFSAMLVAGTKQMTAMKKQQEKALVQPNITYYVSPGDTQPNGTVLVACFGESVVKACSIKHPCESECVNGALYRKQ